MNYYFYYIFFSPTENLVMETVIMAKNKKQAINRLVGKNKECILRIFKLNDAPLIIGV